MFIDSKTSMRYDEIGGIPESIYKENGVTAMRMYDVITKKKHGEVLTEEELHFVVEGFTNGDIPDYQMSALLMAICLNGLNKEETVTLTMEMAKSGDLLDLSKIHGKKADKHSTGGVGDKTTLVVAPIVAALGVPVAKMSGRGLGHTGGTIDKLESIPGFQTKLTEEQFIRNVNEIKLAVVGQTANLAPADKKIYALRDVTATVDNISLIASSIMSKKLAAGADVIVLDVKTGSGAFMKTTEDSIELAKTMVDIGNSCGRNTYAVITDMNQVLGRYVGNVLEVKEAISVLHGEGDEELRTVCETLASFMLVGSGFADSTEQAKVMINDCIQSGRAFEKLCEMVRAQGGDDSYIRNPEKFGRTESEVSVYAPEDGYIQSINAEEIGMTGLILGGGRETKDDVIDPLVGLRVDKKVGDYVRKGDLLGVLYVNRKETEEAAVKRMLGAYRFSPKKADSIPTIYGYVDENGYFPL